jgi:hypothetical protein
MLEVIKNNHLSPHFLNRHSMSNLSSAKIDEAVGLFISQILKSHNNLNESNESGVTMCTKDPNILYYIGKRFQLTHI